MMPSCRSRDAVAASFRTSPRPQAITLLPAAFPRIRFVPLLALLLIGFGQTAAAVADGPATPDYRRDVLPLLQQYCYGCHADGAREGNFALDEHTDETALTRDVSLWWTVWKNVRSDIMPPAYESRPTDEQKALLFRWITGSVFGSDPQHPDPGRTVLRRLNRVEYRNTIKDLMGIDFNTSVEFPPDDSGDGFDNNADALSISPLLTEKYLQAARTIVEQAVPQNLQKAPKEAKRFFQRDAPPSHPDGQRDDAAEVLRQFCSRAYRRPPTERHLQRLLRFAGFGDTDQPAVSDSPGFESRIRRAMIAVLASPRFLFRVDAPAADDDSPFPFADDYSLASRLSYFLWSTMPDETLFELAAAGKLRDNLDQQVERMLADPRSEAFIQSFVGQWLQTRDVEAVSIDPLAALGVRNEYEQLREYLESTPTGRRRSPPKDAPAEHKDAYRRYVEIRRMRNRLDAEVRKDMRTETETLFRHVVSENRPLTELIDAEYAFLNERLAKHYGVPDVDGKQFRRVPLPPESPLGGVLTQGTFLLVTSNPTRTSPVKRGLFILDNILGTPAPPAPAMVPELEEAAESTDREALTLRELLELHRKEPLCQSCHARFDPLGLAFENFTAIGTYRDRDQDAPIEPAGELISGESFDGPKELKKILAGERRQDFYRCLAERLLSYAVGRSLEPGDEITLRGIVDQIQQADGRAQSLIAAVVRSAPVTRIRRTGPDEPLHDKPLSQGNQ